MEEDGAAGAASAEEPHGALGEMWRNMEHLQVETRDDPEIAKAAKLRNTSEINSLDSSRSL